MRGTATKAKAEGVIHSSDVLSIQVLECTATDLPLELHKLSRKGLCRSTATSSVCAVAREQLFQHVVYTKINSTLQ
jgi:hypothetical protein